MNSQIVSAQASLKVYITHFPPFCIFNASFCRITEWLTLAQSEAREHKEEGDLLKTKVESLEVARTEWYGYLSIMLYPHS